VVVDEEANGKDEKERKGEGGGDFLQRPDSHLIEQLAPTEKFRQSRKEEARTDSEGGNSDRGHQKALRKQ